MTTQEIQALIDGATGTDHYYPIGIIPRYVATDGVIAVANAAGCYWLLDAILSHQTNPKLDPQFQVWQLSVKGNKAVLVGSNDDVPVVKQKIEYTDFPLAELKLYLIDNVLLLPNEY